MAKEKTKRRRINKGHQEVRITINEPKKGEIQIVADQYEIWGHYGKFYIYKLDGVWDWDAEDEEYYFTGNKKPLKIEETHHCSLAQCLRYIHNNLWHDMKIGLDDNDIDTFQELLIVAERIDKFMKTLYGECVLATQKWEFIIDKAARNRTEKNASAKGKK